MRTFSEVARGRDNNFNLRWLVASTLVIANHSMALSTGQLASEPLRALPGVSIGDIAVDMSFVTSGFQVLQAILFLWRDVHPLPLLIASAVLTLALAAAPWHLVEQPMLRLKCWLEPKQRVRLRAWAGGRVIKRDSAEPA